jgi:hypothetical protein
MFGKGRSIRVLAAFVVAFPVAVTARPGGELQPDERRDLAEEAKKLDAQAFALYHQGQLQEATAALEKDSAILRWLYPTGHADLANNLNNLGLLLKKRWRNDAYLARHWLSPLFRISPGRVDRWPSPY